MNPIKFKGHNVVFGEGQLEYQPLPALRMPDGEVITCWELSDEELEEIKRTKVIYLKQYTVNGPLQPIMPIVDLSDGIDLINE